MKKIVTLVVVLLLAAGAVFYVYVRSGFAFGISSQHRLGKLDKVEAYLMKVGLEKDPARLNELSKLVLGKQVLYYYDKGSKSEGKDPTDYVTIVADQAGDVQSYRENTLTALGASPPELVIAQHARSHELSPNYGKLERVRVIHQGKNSLSFFAPAAEP